MCNIATVKCTLMSNLTVSVYSLVRNPAPHKLVISLSTYTLIKVIQYHVLNLCYRSRDRVAVIAATVATVPTLKIHSQCDKCLEIKRNEEKVNHVLCCFISKRTSAVIITANIKYTCLLTDAVEFCDSCFLRMSWAALSITT